MRRRLPRMSPRTGVQLLALSGVLLLCLSDPVLGHDAKHGKSNDQPANTEKPAAAEVQVTIADVDLVDRDGRAVNFKTEALADRIVAIDFVYTTCTTACPILSAIFAEVQGELGDRMGRDARLLTISIDPTRDTPGRMDNTARKFGAGPGWLWLTGAKADVDELLVGLGAYTPDISTHPPMILVGDVSTGQWVRLYGFVSPDEVMEQIYNFMTSRGVK